MRERPEEKQGKQTCRAPKHLVVWSGVKIHASVDKRPNGPAPETGRVCDSANERPKVASCLFLLQSTTGRESERERDAGLCHSYDVVPGRIADSITNAKGAPAIQRHYGWAAFCVHQMATNRQAGCNCRASRFATKATKKSSLSSTSLSLFFATV